MAELRRRKARDDKPFAVMVPRPGGGEGAVCAERRGRRGAHVHRSADRARAAAARRAGGPRPWRPGLPDLGLLLPYSPLHHLLLAGVGRPLVMTSGNLSDEPIAHTDDDARDRLAGLVDGVLGHDRAIHIRCDDSVVRARGDGRTQVLRRSRGMAPQPLPLVRGTARPILAVGAELKTTVAVAFGPDVVVSHHIGDLEHLATYQSFLQAIDHLRGLYGVTPEVVAHDLHPEYLSTKLAMDLDLPTVAVQHHHAHVASCLTEHGRPGPVLGLAFDGLGYGTDGTLWGGELLVADLQGFERVGHLARHHDARRSRRHPRAVAHGGGVGARGPASTIRSTTARRAAVLDLVERGHGPVTTSMGRLFDAVAALLGLRPAVSYEAQAAIELEALARSVPRAEAPSYPVEVGRDDGGARRDRSSPARRRARRATGARHGAGGRGRRVPRVDRPGRRGRGRHWRRRARALDGGPHRWGVPERAAERDRRGGARVRRPRGARPPGRAAQRRRHQHRPGGRRGGAARR